jgi:hypothetical protein
VRVVESVWRPSRDQAEMNWRGIEYLALPLRWRDPAPWKRRISHISDDP